MNLSSILRLAFVLGLVCAVPLSAQVISSPGGTGATTTQGGSNLVPTVFNCDPSITSAYANLNTCLNAAKTFVGNANAGSDKAAQVILPQGTLSITPAVAALTLTAAANASSGTTVYTGTITGGGSNAYVGLTFYVTGFDSPSLTLTSAAAASGGKTTYQGTITNGGSNALVGTTVFIAGFDLPANNGTFVVTASTTTAITVTNANGATDSHAATAIYNANNGAFIATASSGTTLTLSNAYGIADTHAASVMSPYALNSGMQIIGTMPRVEYSSGIPDAFFPPNGGTYIDCGGITNMCFGGSNLRGVKLANIGFQDFGAVGAFGGNNVDGISFSNFDNIYINGSATCCQSSLGFQIFNFQHLTINGVMAINFNTLFRFTQQSNVGLYGNSYIGNVYGYSYAKSIANANAITPALIMEVLTPPSGTVYGMNNMVFGHFQMNSNGGDGTNSEIVVNGLSGVDIEGIYMPDADIEGNNLTGIALNYTQFNRFGLTAHSANTYDLLYGPGAFPSQQDCLTNCTVAPLPVNYIDVAPIYGVLNSIPTTNGSALKGAFYTETDDLFHIRTDTLTDGFNNPFPIPFSSLTNSTGSATMQATGSGNNVLTVNSNSGYSQLILEGGANFTSVGLLGGSWNWAFGQFGSNDFKIEDNVAGTAPVDIVQSAPTGSFTISATGTVTHAHLATAGTIAGSICATSAGLVLYEAGATGCTISLAALKRIQGPMTAAEAHATLAALTPIDFSMKPRDGEKVDTRPRLGFTAENVAAANPRLSTYDGKGNLQGYDPNGIIAALVVQVKEQGKKIKKMESRLR